MGGNTIENFVYTFPTGYVLPDYVILTFVALFSYAMIIFILATNILWVVSMLWSNGKWEYIYIGFQNIKHSGYKLTPTLRFLLQLQVIFLFGTVYMLVQLKIHIILSIVYICVCGLSIYLHQKNLKKYKETNVDVDVDAESITE